jgi:hypothetical protein
VVSHEKFRRTTRRLSEELVSPKSVSLKGHFVLPQERVLPLWGGKENGLFGDVCALMGCEVVVLVVQAAAMNEGMKLC